MIEANEPDIRAHKSQSTLVYPGKSSLPVIKEKRVVPREPVRMTMVYRSCDPALGF